MAKKSGYRLYYKQVRNLFIVNLIKSENKLCLSIPNTKITIFEWDQDCTDIVGQHYHCLTPEMKNKHGGDHYHPGDLIPEPWASLYFS